MGFIVIRSDIPDKFSIIGYVIICSVSVAMFFCITEEKMKNNFNIKGGEKMKEVCFRCVMCVNILASGIGVAEVLESHSQWAEESLISADEAELLPNFFADRDLTG